MTQEQKAKAYDEVIGKLQGLIDNANKQGHIIVRVEDIENTFPELKESEDERIRKVLAGFFKSYKEQGTCGSETFNGIPTENILAWLEKQEHEPKWCHHKVDLSGCSEEYRKAYYDGWNNCNQQHSQCKSESLCIGAKVTTVIYLHTNNSN